MAKFAVICSGPAYASPYDWIERAYLKAYDPNWNRGEGQTWFTYDVREALLFDDLNRAVAFVEQVPTNYPMTESGTPNVPMRCFKVEYQAINLDAARRGELTLPKIDYALSQAHRWRQFIGLS